MEFDRSPTDRSRESLLENLFTIFSKFSVSFWHSLFWFIVSQNVLPILIHLLYLLRGEVLQWREWPIPVIQHKHYYSFVASVLFIVPQRGKDQGSACSNPWQCWDCHIITVKFAAWSSGAHQTHTQSQALVSSASLMPAHNSTLAHTFTMDCLLELKRDLLFFHLLLKLSKAKLCLKAFPFLLTQVKVFSFSPPAYPSICVIMGTDQRQQPHPTTRTPSLSSKCSTSSPALFCLDSCMQADFCDLINQHISPKPK